MHGLPKFFRALIYRAHRAVILAIAQLSCFILYCTEHLNKQNVTDLGVGDEENPDSDYHRESNMLKVELGNDVSHSFLALRGTAVPVLVAMITAAIAPVTSWVTMVSVVLAMICGRIAVARVVSHTVICNVLLLMTGGVICSVWLTSSR